MKVNMIWQNLEEAKVNLPEYQMPKVLQKEQLIFYQEKATSKGKVLIYLDLQNFKENENIL